MLIDVLFCEWYVSTVDSFIYFFFHFSRILLFVFIPIYFYVYCPPSRSPETFYVLLVLPPTPQYFGVVSSFRFQNRLSGRLQKHILTILLPLISLFNLVSFIFFHTTFLAMSTNAFLKTKNAKQVPFSLPVVSTFYLIVNVWSCVLRPLLNLLCASCNCVSSFSFHFVSNFTATFHNVIPL